MNSFVSIPILYLRHAEHLSRFLVPKLGNHDWRLLVVYYLMSDSVIEGQISGMLAFRCDLNPMITSKKASEE
jgi:hypothetical protein